MLSSPESDSIDSSLKCDYPGCHAAYQRKEHLNRHMSHHNRRERCSCPYCDSTLTRRHALSDLLRRHVRKYHPDRELPQSRALRACTSCHARKERCDGGYPCARCQRRGTDCSLTRQKTVLVDRTMREKQTLFSIDLVGFAPGTSRWIGQDFLDIYFRDFHPAWPFLHRGTFKMSTEPCVLVQSMVMMGLYIKGDQKSRDTAMTFHTKLISAIEAQKSEWYVSESTSGLSNEASWPIATFQSVLLQIIFALFVAERETTFDLSCRYRLSAPAYGLLTALVETCRQVGLFCYPTMLSKHHPSAPLALVWYVGHVLLVSLPTRSLPFRRDGHPLKSELLTLADLNFCLPDSDELWNAPPSQRPALIRGAASQQLFRDNRDSGSWISQTSRQLNDASVSFDWI
ncbi:hypothetical protein N7533_006439 [Penicillium manginii]|uniref:uncharacterized protein n=1 Tax=Penicillium manginii TaxID=203109 RepID=UPI0025494584|nr:uncharacterized protein N7533_006439 [Penicillium manginii]KAJ5749411.1 hypothetical protein N7533_006439 [Penicillium manginii]